MGIISFSSDGSKNWTCAGWAFRQVLRDVASALPGNRDIQQVLLEAEHIDALMIEYLPKEIASQIIAALREVTTRTLNGETRSGITEQPFFNELTALQYRQAIQDLLAKISVLNRDDALA